jgi:hypothetical protein
MTIGRRLGQRIALAFGMALALASPDTGHAATAPGAPGPGAPAPRAVTGSVFDDANRNG